MLRQIIADIEAARLRRHTNKASVTPYVARLRAAEALVSCFPTR